MHRNLKLVACLSLTLLSITSDVSARDCCRGRRIRYCQSTYNTRCQSQFVCCTAQPTETTPAPVGKATVPDGSTESPAPKPSA